VPANERGDLLIRRRWPAATEPVERRERRGILPRRTRVGLGRILVVLAGIQAHRPGERVVAVTVILEVVTLDDPSPAWLIFFISLGMSGDGLRVDASIS